MFDLLQPVFCLGGGQSRRVKFNHLAVRNRASPVGCDYAVDFALDIPTSNRIAGFAWASNWRRHRNMAALLKLFVLLGSSEQRRHVPAHLAIRSSDLFTSINHTRAFISCLQRREVTWPETHQHNIVSAPEHLE
jgi:hypothetical protein